MTTIADLPAIDQFKLALAVAMDSETFEADNDPDDRDELYPTPTTLEMALHVADLIGAGHGLGCQGYEKEVDLLEDTVKLLAANLRAALDHTTVEVLHQRDPDEGCDITVWVNGIKHDAEIDDIDPGRGYDVDDWDEQTDELRARPGLSDAFRSAAVAARVDARSSKYIDRADEPYDDEDGDDNGMEVVQP